MKYMILSSTGVPNFYSEDIHGPLTIDGQPNPAYPAGGIEISDEQWMTFLTKQPAVKWDAATSSFVDAELPAAAPVIVDIDRRQICQQLAAMGKISEAEALAWIQNQALPAAILAAVGKLPAAEQFPAKALLFGALTFQRSSPLAGTLGALLEMDGDALDALWVAAAQL